MKCYSAYDTKANEHYFPFEADHDTGAIREIQKVMQQNPIMNRMVLHRNEFVLVRLGDFDPTLGIFEQVTPATVQTFSAIYAELMQKLEVPDVNGKKKSK